MTFTIIKDAELPKNSRGRLKQYPFKDMDVGDGFDAPRDMGKRDDSSDRRQSSICAAAYLWAKRHNPDAKFTVRILDKNTVRCVRVA